MNEIYISELDSNLLEDVHERVLFALSSQSDSDEYIKKTAQQLINESHKHIKIKFGYQIVKSGGIKVGYDSISINNSTIFHCKRIITKQLKDAEGLVLFAATLGNEFDLWFKGLFNSSDYLEGYLADLIGSVSVESAADILEAKIRQLLKENNTGCSNRYSPGYCNWNVSEQRKLFNLLPEKFCGIELTESSLMIPIKSVSGIIGFGKNVEKNEYECKICTQENCYMKKLKII